MYSSRVLSILPAYPLFELSVFISSSVRAVRDSPAWIFEISAMIAQTLFYLKKDINEIQLKSW